MPLFRSRLSQAAMLVLLVILAYWPLRHAGFVWDDDHMLTDNSLIRAGNGIYQFWFTRNAPDYWPVTSTTLWVEWRLWGIHPLGYHLTNLALHLASVLLVCSILRRLGVGGAWLGALLFGVHPLNVESVTWIAERKNGLAMVFYLLSIVAWLRSDGSAGEPPNGLRLDRWYWLGLGAFALGMLSKGSVATLPLVSFGLILWRRRPGTADWVRLLPFIAVAAGLAAVDIWFQRHGSAEAIRPAGLLERFLGAGAVVWFYLGKALWPSGLMFVYPQWRISTADFRWWLPLLGLGVVTALLIRWTAGEDRDVAGAWRRGTLFAWGYFCVSLIPVLGLVDVYFMKYSLVADHYAHLALIGVTAWAAFVVHAVYRRTSAVGRVGLNVAVAIAVAALTGLCWDQNLMFRDNLTLSRTLLASDPNAWMGHMVLATELGKTPGNAPEAIAHFERALQLRPGDAPAHNDLAIQLEQIPGRTDEAVAQFEEALRINPNFAAAHGNLATLLAHVPGGLPEAIQHYEAAVQMSPTDAELHNNLAVALGKIPERWPQARAEFEAALRLDPNDPDFHYDYGNFLAKTSGGMPQAEQQYEEALRLKPNFVAAHFNLAVISAALGDFDQARNHFERVLRLDPANDAARARLNRLRNAP